MPTVVISRVLVTVLTGSEVAMVSVVVVSCRIVAITDVFAVTHTELVVIDGALMGKAVPGCAPVSVINDAPVSGVPFTDVVEKTVLRPVIMVVLDVPVMTETMTEATVPVWTTPSLVTVKVEIGIVLFLDSVVNDMAARGS